MRKLTLRLSRECKSYIKYFYSKILGRRRRFEVCESLKRSSILFNLSIVKSLVKIMVNIFFLTINIIFGHEEKALITSKRPCVIAVNPIPELQVFRKTNIHFQCDGKKTDFFLTLLECQIVLQFFLLCLSLSMLVWSFYSRRQVEMSQRKIRLT